MRDACPELVVCLAVDPQSENEDRRAWRVRLHARHSLPTPITESSAFSGALRLIDPSYDLFPLSRLRSMLDSGVWTIARSPRGSPNCSLELAARDPNVQSPCYHHEV